MIELSTRDAEILHYKWLTDLTNKQITEKLGWSKSTLNEVVRKYLPQQAEIVAQLSNSATPTATDTTTQELEPKGSLVTELPTEVPEPPHFVTDDVVTVYIDGKVFTFDHTHPNYQVIRSSIEKKDWADVSQKADYKKNFKTWTFGFFKITEDGQLLHHGKPVKFEIAKQVIALNEKDVKPTALLKFLERLKSNPSTISLESTLRFVTNNQLPIDSDGFLYTYKKINPNYTDVHTGKIDNSIGQVVCMERDQVTLDPSRSCAAGLHVCSYSYLSNFGGSRIMVCKVDPADIVSVPHDYHNAKMRVMRYEVIHELNPGEKIPDNHIDSTCYWYK